MIAKKKSEDAEWHNYSGYSRESDAKKDGKFLVKSKYCKTYKIIPKGSEDGTIYWLYTQPKVI